MSFEFKSEDGSVWKRISASKLCLYPIWNGNRIIDQYHIKTLEEKITDPKLLNNSLFRTITYWNMDDTMETFIIDGQHRVEILKKYLIKNPDFDVIVTDKILSSDKEAIDYFNIINSNKNINWKEDPILIANKFVAVFEMEFNNKFGNVIRPGKTRKPYLSSDKIREELVKKKINLWKKTPTEFVEESFIKNNELLSRLNNYNSLESKAISLGFSLGCIDIDEWI
jgi:hypothetical protein